MMDKRSPNHPASKQWVDPLSERAFQEMEGDDQDEFPEFKTKLQDRDKAQRVESCKRRISVAEAKAKPKPKKRPQAAGQFARRNQRQRRNDAEAAAPAVVPAAAAVVDDGAERRVRGRGGAGPRVHNEDWDTELCELCGAVIGQFKLHEHTQAGAQWQIRAMLVTGLFATHFPKKIRRQQYRLNGTEVDEEWVKDWLQKNRESCGCEPRAHGVA